MVDFGLRSNLKSTHQGKPTYTITLISGYEEYKGPHLPCQPHWPCYLVSTNILKFGFLKLPSPTTCRRFDLYQIKACLRASVGGRSMLLAPLTISPLFGSFFFCSFPCKGCKIVPLCKRAPFPIFFFLFFFLENGAVFLEKAPF